MYFRLLILVGSIFDHLLFDFLKLHCHKSFVESHHKYLAPDSSLNCFQHGNLYRLLSFVPVLALYVIAFVALIYVFLWIFRRFFYSLPLLILFEFLIIVFSSLSFWFSSGSKILIHSILMKLSFSSFRALPILPGVISYIYTYV